MTARDEMDLPSLIWTDNGLIPVIVQEAGTGKVLMMAWMNQQALDKTLQTGEAHYWSRSRQTLWHKGETSGAVQKLKAIYVDCDQDTLLLIVEQSGKGACHTGRKTCFYRRLDNKPDGKRRLVFCNPGEDA